MHTHTLQEVHSRVWSLSPILNQKLQRVITPDDMSNVDLAYLLWVKDFLTRITMSSTETGIVHDLEQLKSRYCHHTERKSARSAYADFLDTVSEWIDATLEFIRNSKK